MVCSSERERSSEICLTKDGETPQNSDDQHTPSDEYSCPDVDFPLSRERGGGGKERERERVLAFDTGRCVFPTASGASQTRDRMLGFCSDTREI